jgi:hypothetical protein
MGRKLQETFDYSGKLRIKLFPFTRPMMMEKNVPKRRHIKFRRRRTTRKKERKNTTILNVRIT